MADKTTKNDVTGDSLRSKPTSDAYRDNWETIFGSKSKEKKPENKGEEASARPRMK